MENHIIYFLSNKTIKNLSYLFYKCKSLKEINLLSFNTNNIQDMSGMSSECSSLKEINLSSFNTNNGTYMCSLFEDLPIFYNIITKIQIY